MTTLTHGRGWLNDGPAASLHRMDAARGSVIPLTSAGRTRAEQQVLWDRWQAGGTYNRPPYLYQPAAPGQSPHEAGNAIDIGDNTARAWVIAYGGAHGWRQNIKNDLVHFIYEPGNDQHRTATLRPGSLVTLDQAQQIAAWLARSYGSREYVYDLQQQAIWAGILPEGERDGKYGPKTAAAEKAIWETKVAPQPAPEPEPAPEPPTPIPEPPAEPDPTPEPPEETPMPDTPTPPAGVTDEQLAAILATVEKAGIEAPDEPIIPDHIAKPAWVILALLSITVPFVLGLTVIDWASWSAATATQVSGTTVGWLGLIAATLGLSRYAKTKP